MQEYCGGGSLSALVQRGHLHNHRSSECGVAVEHLLTILCDVAAGMACMHKQNIGELLHSHCTWLQLAEALWS
jgi:hypothetical protein